MPGGQPSHFQGQVGLHRGAEVAAVAPVGIFGRVLDDNGVPGVEQQPEVADTDQQSKNIIPPSQPHPKDRPITKPELSKDVKKVFGEDEEF